MATHKPKIVHELNGKLEPSKGEAGWYVIRTKSRREKQLADFAKLCEITYYLPQLEVVHRYNYRQVTFTKPMFSGYVFAMISPRERESLSITGLTAGFIKVIDERELLDELLYIYEGKKRKAGFEHAVWLSEGLEVEIVSGPLKGMHGVVENHQKINEVRLQVNILRQAVMVKVNPKDVKILGEYIIVDKEGTP